MFIRVSSSPDPFLLLPCLCSQQIHVPSTAHSVNVHRGFTSVSATVLLSIWQRNRDAPILGSSVCADIDLKCDYKKIILIGAIASLFHRTLPFYDDVNESEFIMCLEKSE